MDIDAGKLLLLLLLIQSALLVTSSIKSEKSLASVECAHRDLLRKLSARKTGGQRWQSATQYNTRFESKCIKPNDHTLPTMPNGKFTTIKSFARLWPQEQPAGLYNYTYKHGTNTQRLEYERKDRYKIR